MSNKRYQSQLQAAMSMKLHESAEVTEAQEEEGSVEQVVLEYLNSFFGQDITESVDSLSEEDLIEAVQSLNVLCAIVNEYFEVD